jgi:anti-anti-sigma factor
MTQALVTVKSDSVLTISISGRFNSCLVQEFRDVFREIDGQKKSIVIDLADAEYIDSAALGLMIHMKKKLKQSNVETIRVINSNARIRKVFSTMKFENMFDIDVMECS